MISAGNVPPVNALLLAGMVVCGVIGSEMGGQINKRLSEKKATLLVR